MLLIVAVYLLVTLWLTVPVRKELRGESLRFCLLWLAVAPLCGLWAAWKYLRGARDVQSS